MYALSITLVVLMLCLIRMSQNQNRVLRAWEERVVSPGRGNRVVHYILRDSTENSFVAVVGIERSKNHIIYSATEDCLRIFGSSHTVHAGTRWKARKDVVQFLMSITSIGGPLFATSGILCSYRTLMVRFSEINDLQEHVHIYMIH